MQSSNHIGKIVRQHADAVENGKTESRSRKAKDSGVSVFNTVPKHRAFVPMVTIWGGLLLGLIIAVLPDHAIGRASSLTGVYMPLVFLRLILSAGIGLCGALLGFIVASALSNRAQIIAGDGILVSTFKSRDVDPINPVVDLGSESFDAPIAEEPASEPVEFFELDASFAEEETEVREPNLGELSQRGYDIGAPEDFDEQPKPQKKGEWAFTRKHFKDALIDSCEGATCEAAPGWEKAPEWDEVEPSEQKVVEPSSEEPKSAFGSLTPDLVTPRSDKPRALDLEQFGQLSGRDGVWVEETSSPEPVSPAVPAEKQAKPLQTPKNALEKLRQTPAEELSLVEMVERFAAALHDHQSQERKRHAAGQGGRETALVEALKALSLFTEAGFDKADRGPVSDSDIGQTEEELRAALQRLQHLRGAA